MIEILTNNFLWIAATPVGYDEPGGGEGDPQCAWICKELWINYVIIKG